MTELLMFADNAYVQSFYDRDPMFKPDPFESPHQDKSRNVKKSSLGCRSARNILQVYQNNVWIESI